VSGISYIRPARPVGRHHGGGRRARRDHAGAGAAGHRRTPDRACSRFESSPSRNRVAGVRRWTPLRHDADRRHSFTCFAAIHRPAGARRSLLTDPVGDPACGALPTQSTERLARRRSDAGFGPGLTSQLVVVARIPATSRRPGQSVAAAPSRPSPHRGRRVHEPLRGHAGSALLVGKVFRPPGSDPQTTALVSRLQDDGLPQQLTHLGYTGTSRVSPRQMALQNAVRGALAGDHPRGRGAAMLLILFHISGRRSGPEGRLQSPSLRSSVLRLLIAVFQWVGVPALFAVPQPSRRLVRAVLMLRHVSLSMSRKTRRSQG